MWSSTQQKVELKETKNNELNHVSTEGKKQKQDILSEKTKETMNVTGQETCKQKTNLRQTIPTKSQRPNVFTQ